MAGFEPEETGGSMARSEAEKETNRQSSSMSRSL